jgi:addiction module RelE/StbE family toxin
VIIQVVQTSKRAKKSLEKVPKHVAAKFALWRLEVMEKGLAIAQKVPSYHDESLTGKLKGIRSIRLSDGYRAYYRIIKETIEIVFVEEVNKHDYKAIERLFNS